MLDSANNLTGFIVLVATLGIAAQWLAWRFHLPAILLLSVAGMVVGPWLGWMDFPQQPVEGDVLLSYVPPPAEQ